MESFTLFLIVMSILVVAGTVYFYYNRKHWKKYFAILGTIGAVGCAILITPVTYMPLEGKYTTTTETHCIDGKCWTALYSGIRFIPVEGVFGKGYVKIEDYKHSLKEYFNVKYLDYASGLEIKVKDFGYDWIEFDFSVKDEKYLKQMLPIKVDNQQVKTFLWNEKDDIRSYRIEGKNILSSNYTFGKNSTTIMLQDADSENLEDTYVNTGDADSVHGDSVAINYGSYDNAADRYEGYYKFDISSLSEQSILVTDSSLCIYLYLERIEETLNLTLNYLPNQTWTENITWNTRPINNTYDNYTEVSSTQSVGWICMNGTIWVQNQMDAKNDNISFYVNYSGATTNDDLIYTYSKEYGTIEIRPYLNITYEIIADNPRYFELNETSGTGAGTVVLHSEAWNSTDEGNSNMSHYIFEWYNGINWTTIEETADKETGIVSVGGALGGGDSSFYDNFNTGTKWSEEGDCASYWKYGSSTPTPNTGPQNGDYDSTNFVYMETSSGSCDGSPSSGYLMYIPEIDWDVGTDDNISFRTNFYGADEDLGMLTVWENSTGDWLEMDWYTENDDGGSGLVWTYHSIDASSLAGSGHLKFYLNECVSFQGDAAIDAFNITLTVAPTINDTNTTPTTYTDVGLSPYDMIDNITVTVNVTLYNSTLSTAHSNSLPDLWLEISDDGIWEEVGNFSVSGTGNKSLSYTSISVWDDDIRIKGRYIDQNDSHFDEIKWNAVYVRAGSQQQLKNETAVTFTDAMCGTPKNDMCWSNVTQTISSTAGHFILWRIYGNTTNLLWNATPLHNYTVTSSGAADISSSLTTNILLVDVNDTGCGCGPDYSCIWVEPENQSASVGIYNLTNNGTITGNFQAKLDGTQEAGWSIYISNSTDTANAINLTTSWQTFRHDVVAGNWSYNWFYTDCDQVSIAPGVDIVFQAIS